MKLRHRFVVLVTAVMVCASAVGCCCRTKKGFVLRGDWSLEMNRVPHMKSNGPQYEPDCCEADCGEAACGEVTCGCPNGCTDGGCVGGSACRMQGGDGHASASYGGPGFAGGAGYGPDRGFVAGGMHDGFGGGEGDHMPPPPNPTAAANTRFHPVPTRPVFERQVEALEPAPAGEWVPAARSKSPTTR